MDHTPYLKLYSSIFGTSPGLKNVLLSLQTFDTVPGRTYTVRFAMSGHPGAVGQTKDFVVSAADYNKRYTTTPAKDAYHLDWKPVTFEFTAKENRSTLKFESPNEVTGWWGAYIDNVVVNETTQLQQIRPSTRAMKSID